MLFEFKSLNQNIIIKIFRDRSKEYSPTLLLALCQSKIEEAIGKLTDAQYLINEPKLDKTDINYNYTQMINKDYLKIIDSLINNLEENIKQLKKFKFEQEEKFRSCP